MASQEICPHHKDNRLGTCGFYPETGTCLPPGDPKLGIPISKLNTPLKVSITDSFSLVIVHILHQHPNLGHHLTKEEITQIAQDITTAAAQQNIFRR